MTGEEFTELVDNYIKHLRHMISNKGGLPPHITIFANHKDEEESTKPAVVHIMIPDECVESEDAKDEFVDEILPGIFKELRKKFSPHAIAWASGAWLRVVEPDADLKNWKQIPIKKEVVIVSIETKDKSSSVIYNMHRNGKQVTKEGKIVDQIELEIAEDMKNSYAAGGRFTGLFRKFKNL